MKEVMIYFLLFIIYSFIGWIMEILITTTDRKKIVNRGFLIGPYLPIYGTGALSIIIVLKPYHHDYFVLFIMSILVCSTIEYITSYLMEKFFKARWWDYSHIPFNLNGRICLAFSLFFGFMGSLIVLINNHLYSFLNNVPLILTIIVFSLLALIFLTDLIISFNIVNKIKLSANNLRKDYSEEITEKVKQALENNSFLIKRLLKAFPDIKISQKKK